jgi:hypothetical protein
LDCTRNSIAFVMRKLLYASHGNAFSAVGVVGEAEDSTINSTSRSFLHRGKREKGMPAPFLPHPPLTL